MMGLLLVAFMLMTVALSAVIGKGRFYLQHTRSGREFQREYYGAWLAKAFAGLSAVGFSILVLIPLAEIVAAIARDDTEKPYFFSIYPAALLGIGYFQLILKVARRCENNYQYRKLQEFTVPAYVQGGKTIVDVNDLMAAYECAQRKMSQYAILDPDAEVDIIDPTIPAEMKRIKRSTMRQLKIEASRHHRGWGVVRQTEPYIVIGNLALDDKKPLAREAEPQANNAAMPIVNLKPTPEELLELQLAALPQADRELVEQLFSTEPVIRRWALQPNCLLRLSIVPETDQAPRHIRIRGIVYQRRVQL